VVQRVSVLFTIDSQPFVEIFSFRQLNSLPQTAAAECRFSKLSELVAACAFVCVAGFELSSRPSVTVDTSG
jgi:hypothetical protein